MKSSFFPRVLLSFFLPMFAVLTVAAQHEHEYPHHPANRNHKRSHPHVHAADSAMISEKLEANAPQEFDIQGGPKFAIMGREGLFYLGIGGFVKGTVSFDWGNTMDNSNEFVTSAIPMSRAAGNGGRFNASAMQTMLYLNFIGLPGRKDEFGGFVGMNFLNNYTPVLQFAYVTYRGIKLGIDYSLFSDPSAMPPTIDYEGPCSATTLQHAVANYTRSFGRNGEWKVGAGIEMPEVSVTEGANAVAVSQRVPAIPAFVQWSWADSHGWIRLSGILRNMQYRDLIARKNVNKAGWGVEISGSSEILPNLTAYWQGVFGRGIASYMQDCTGLGLDMAPLPADNSRLDLVKAWGGYAALQYNFTDDLFISGTYSHVRTYLPAYSSEGASTPRSEQYRYGQYVQGAIFWNINTLFQTGIEYIYGRRVDYSGASGHDNRLQVMLQLNF